MVDSAAIRSRIENSGYRYDFVAVKLGCTRQTLANKLKGTSEWTMKDVEAMANLLQLSVEEIITLFFAHEVKK